LNKEGDRSLSLSILIFILNSSKKVLQQLM